MQESLVEEFENKNARFAHRTSSRNHLEALSSTIVISNMQKSKEGMKMTVQQTQVSACEEPDEKIPTPKGFKFIATYSPDREKMVEALKIIRATKFQKSDT